MRDLANQGALGSTKIRIPRTQFKIIVALVLILVILFVAKMLFSNSGSIVGSSSISLKDAPGGLTPVNVSKTSAASGGINLSKQTATLHPVGDVSGSATATRTYGDGSYNLSVSATLPDPHANSYAVFLVGADGPVFLDFMTGSGKSWSLNFNDKDKYSKLNGIWITQKITKELKTPETHILEGSF